MLTSYYKQKAEREENGLPPLPLNLEEIQELVKIIESNKGGEELISLLENEVSPGVDETAYVKAGFLKDIALEKINISLITPERAISILGTMLGGYSVEALVEILKAEKFGDEVANALKNTILVYDSFNDIFEMRDKNDSALQIINSWSEAEWFTSKKDLPDKIPLVCFSTSGGARMQESMISLFQMGKTSAAVKRLKNSKIPFISILVDPCYGGVSASLAMLGDLVISEPKARIGFAGKRVIKDTVKEDLPKDFQTAEKLLEKGFIDKIIDRKNLREFLSKIFKILGQT